MTDNENSVGESETWAAGVAIRDARERMGLSAREAARQAGIGDGTWRYVEAGFEVKRGQRFPVKSSPTTLAKMAKVVGLDPTQLLRLAGFDRQPVGLKSQPYSSSQSATRALDLDGLDEYDLDQLETFIAGLRARKGQT